MLTVIVGQTFHRTWPKRLSTRRRSGSRATCSGRRRVRRLLRERAKVPFKVMVPTVLERTSWIDRERPVRMWIDPDGKHKTIRLTYRTGANEYWGVQMTDWEDAPVISERNFTARSADGATSSTTLGPKLHMIVLRQGGATYWVVNTLLDSLSNETMIAIAKGLRPIDKVK